MNELGPRHYIESAGGEFTLILQPDQYLTLRDRNDGFVWHLDHTGARVTIDDDGFVCVWSDKRERTWRYDGAFVNSVSAAMPKEFSFRVSPTGSVEVIQGEGAAAVMLYKLHG